MSETCLHAAPHGGGLVLGVLLGGAGIGAGLAAWALGGGLIAAIALYLAVPNLLLGALMLRVATRGGRPAAPARRVAHG